MFSSNIFASIAGMKPAKSLPFSRTTKVGSDSASTALASQITLNSDLNTYPALTASSSRPQDPFSGPNHFRNMSSSYTLTWSSLQKSSVENRFSMWQLVHHMYWVVNYEPKNILTAFSSRVMSSPVASPKTLKKSSQGTNGFCETESYVRFTINASNRSSSKNIENYYGARYARKEELTSNSLRTLSVNLFFQKFRASVEAKTFSISVASCTATIWSACILRRKSSW